MMGNDDLSAVRVGTEKSLYGKVINRAEVLAELFGDVPIRKCS